MTKAMVEAGVRKQGEVDDYIVNNANLFAVRNIDYTLHRLLGYCPYIVNRRSSRRPTPTVTDSLTWRSSRVSALRFRPSTWNRR